MKDKIACYTVEEFMDLSDSAAEEVKEWYGEDVVKLYWIELGDDNVGAFIGVEYAEGTYAVYGCRRDTEGLTYEQMCDMLVGEFE